MFKKFIKMLSDKRDENDSESWQSESFDQEISMVSMKNNETTSLASGSDSQNGINRNIETDHNLDAVSSQD